MAPDGSCDIMGAYPEQVGQPSLGIAEDAMVRQPGNRGIRRYTLPRCTVNGQGRLLRLARESHQKVEVGPEIQEGIRQMLLPPVPHRWTVPPSEATEIQQRLARLVKSTRPGQTPRYVAGLDCAFTRDDDRCVAGVVLWDATASVVVEEHTTSRRLSMPYIPGLLSFREGPSLLAVLRKLRRKPDVLMCDGQGIAHPRRLGIASHLGVVTGIPSIGCAKSRLCGVHDQPADERGSQTPLIHRGEAIGAVVRTRNRVRPLYISIGHLVDLDAAVAAVLDCGAGYRLPEPTRLADQLVGRAKREMPHLKDRAPKRPQ